MDSAVREFQGEYRFLSNFYPAEVELDGVTYPTVEHAFQAAKANDDDYLKQREKIRQAPRPGLAKRWGRSIRPLRSDWDDVRIGIMEQLIRQKFSKEPLRSQLLSTGSAELIEGNYWNDTFWGVCKGVGKNHLGKIIMRIREEI